MKIAINKCFGGFDLSLEAQKLYCERKGIGFYPYKQTKYKFQDGKGEYTYIKNLEECGSIIHISNTYLGDTCEDIPNDNYWAFCNVERNDKDLIDVIEILGDDASGRYGNIKIVDIPDDVIWEIDDYDGVETVHEVHRSW